MSSIPSASSPKRAALTRLARAYYRTTQDSIRRYALSFQDFRDPVAHLNAWHRKTGKPVLLADAARLRHPAPPGRFIPNDGEWYADVLAALFDNPGCIALRTQRSATG